MKSKEYFEKIMQDYNQNGKGRRIQMANRALFQVAKAASAGQNLLGYQ